MNKFIIFLLVTGLFTLTAFSQSPDILLNGTVSAQENQIKNVADPTDAQDAVTKKLCLFKSRGRFFDCASSFKSPKSDK
jgi:hypothetical protein